MNLGFTFDEYHTRVPLAQPEVVMLNGLGDSHYELDRST